MLAELWESAHPTSAHCWLRPSPRLRPKTPRRPAQFRGTQSLSGDTTGQENLGGLGCPQAGGPSVPVMCKQTHSQHEAAETLRPQRGPLSPLSHLQQSPHSEGHLHALLEPTKLTQSLWSVATAGPGSWATESLLAAPGVLPTNP